MALEEYKKKRRFEDTPEPPPKVEKKGQSAIRDAATGEKVVTPFPMPAKPR